MKGIDLDARWSIWIDTGGTFTDCIAHDPSGNLHKIKILSNARLRGRIIRSHFDRLFVSVSWPVNADIFNSYFLRFDGKENETFKIKSSDLFEGIIVIDNDPGNVTGFNFEIFSDEEAPIMAARLLTNCTLHDPLPYMDMRLGSTKGTNALLERKGSNICFITNQGLRDLLEIGTQQRPDIFSLNIRKKESLYSSVCEVSGRIDSDGHEILELDESSIEKLKVELERVRHEGLAITLINSFINCKHEKLLAKKLENAGFEHISISSSLSDQIGLISRAQTTVVNAYLSKTIRVYITNVKSKIDDGKLTIMTSAGGLVDSELFKPKDSLLSGPAGGVVGAVKIAKELGEEKVLTFDMGGTSTDVSRYAGNYDYSFEIEIDHISILSPALAIETVAAGGGSICCFDGYKIGVGPESAGAYPGPACYGNGGPLTITDINFLLGRIHQSNFSIPLSIADSEAAFSDVMKSVDLESSKENILMGFLRVANEKMAEAIRKISFGKGYDPSEYSLLAFGGAGGQHACEVASLLNITKVIVPFDAGLLSAFGIGNAEIERIVSRQLLVGFSEVNELIEGLFHELKEEALMLLEQEGIPGGRTYVRNMLVYMRFKGQENVLEIEYEQDKMYDHFKSAYQKQYGHWLENEEIEVESIKLVAAEDMAMIESDHIEINQYEAKPKEWTKCYVSESWNEVPMYIWEELNTGAKIAGPGILMSNNSTVFIDDAWDVTILEGKNAVLVKNVRSNLKRTIRYSQKAELELFTNRFKAVADDMGAILQRTSFSVNVKERLDFSCAVLDCKGYLVANAPHIPVHLGSLGICVRKVIEKLNMEKGDVAITNHPAFGGSHLPDVTLIAPVFFESEVVAFVCNRAHHAELGGITPGSMPATAKSLAEEGVVIEPTFLVKNSKPQWGKIRKLLVEYKYPTRAIEENLADLNGALASIRTGKEGILALCQIYGKDTVMSYMNLLLDYSGKSLFNTFRKFSNKRWQAEEYLDDGSKIKVEINKSENQIIFDFDGTSPVHHGNLNANLAILNSAIIYVLRLMLEEHLPLNEGIMKYVQIKAPTSMINPQFPKDPWKSPAVVGGNTETSQRIVDTLIKALKLAACSQGTMNNLIFGNEHFGFYETIGGGVGAGDGFDGAHAIHQHMTNTKITDPEVMEYRYPISIEKVGIRRKSGGKGRWKGWQWYSQTNPI